MKFSTEGRYGLRPLLDLSLRQCEKLVFTIQPGLESFVEVLRVIRYQRAIQIPTKIKKTYLVHSAIKSAHPGVMKVVLPYFTDVFGNSSGIYSYGQEAKGTVEEI